MKQSVSKRVERRIGAVDVVEDDDRRTLTGQRGEIGHPRGHDLGSLRHRWLAEAGGGAEPAAQPLAFSGFGEKRGEHGVEPSEPLGFGGRIRQPDVVADERAERSGWRRPVGTAHVQPRRGGG